MRFREPLLPRLLLLLQILLPPLLQRLLHPLFLKLQQLLPLLPLLPLLRPLLCLQSLSLLPLLLLLLPLLSLVPLLCLLPLLLLVPLLCLLLLSQPLPSWTYAVLAPFQDGTKPRQLLPQALKPTLVRPPFHVRAKVCLRGR